MISGSARGAGGRALSAHLLKAEADQVTRVIEPRGVITKGDLHAQLREVVAGTAHHGTQKPCYHVHVDPPPEAVDSQQVLDRFWQAFESEFGLESQSYVGAQHTKHARHHEHRVYSIVRDDGVLANLDHDYARRTFVGYLVAFELGLPAIATPFARACYHRAEREGRVEMAAWLLAAGVLEGDAPIAKSTPRERLMESRTGVSLDDVRAAALDAWNASSDGEGLRRELAARGLRLAQGTAGAVVVDKSGTPHALSRVIGAASRIATGNRIPAAAVRTRVAGLQLEDWNGKRGSAGRGAGDPLDSGHLDRGAGGGPGGRPGERADRGLGDPGQGRRGPGNPGHPVDDGGIRFAAAARRAFTRGRLRLMLAGIDLRAVRSAEDLAERMREISSRKEGPWVPGMTDQWGIPLP
ncbi:relaxase/mobilization nuclease domain-containing protein [Bosea sp. (in: a-proteobacteria)]|uniref:relaxase/mobilization nuclease domain-containing protein n=1 Tax=Bosea sp. (in: a-proteobacteria) TaxID=1871050 RepID=UPI00273301C3|nr:hypothetical protein [Bosea sp. (in: a-proteobacteria)]MDP3408102.1 hypothetical protein [Bosea sp. (in: a-proteobacteria)]